MMIGQVLKENDVILMMRQVLFMMKGQVVFDMLRELDHINHAGWSDNNEFYMCWLVLNQISLYLLLPKGHIIFRFECCLD